MKNIIIGIILGFVLTLSVEVIAYNRYNTEFEEDVIELLQQLQRHGEDISSDTQTIIDKL